MSRAEEGEGAEVARRPRAMAKGDEETEGEALKYAKGKMPKWTKMHF